MAIIAARTWRGGVSKVCSPRRMVSRSGCPGFALSASERLRKSYADVPFTAMFDRRLKPGLRGRGTRSYSPTTGVCADELDLAQPFALQIVVSGTTGFASRVSVFIDRPRSARLRSEHLPSLR